MPVEFVLETARLLRRCGLEAVGEIDLTKPTRHGSILASLFRISRMQAFRE